MLRITTGTTMCANHFSITHTPGILCYKGVTLHPINSYKSIVHTRWCQCVNVIFCWRRSGNWKEKF